MPDPDDSLEILIRMTADTSGGKETANALDEVGKKTQEASGATEGHNKHLHEMHRIFHALNGIVPGLGVLMQAAFSPVGAAISLGVIALRGFQEHLKKVNEELDRVAEANAKPLTNRLEIMREVVIRNAASMVELGLQISNAARSEETLAKAIDEVIAQMRRESDEVLALGEIRSKGELAILENLHQAGLISERDYARQRLGIEEDLANKKRKIAEDGLQAEINIRKSGAEAAENAQPGFTANAESARKETERTLTEALTARSGMETAKENAKTAAEALNKWEEAHKPGFLGRDLLGTFQTAGAGANAKDVAGAMFPGKLNESTPEFREAEEQFKEWQTLKGTADKTKRLADKSPGEVAKKETAASGAQNEYRLAGEDAAKNAGLARTQREDVARKERELDATKQANKDLSKAEHDANQLSRPRGQVATQDLAEAVKTALHFIDTPEMYRARHPGVMTEDARKAVNVERHEPVSGQDVQQMTDLATRITGHRTGLNEALTVLGKAAQDTHAATEDVGKLVTIMENLTKNAQHHSGRIDRLESQVRALDAQHKDIFNQ
jgi:hypothetical protein